MENMTEKMTGEVLKIRFAQIFINEECKAGKFKIPIHLAIGHEAVAVALNHILEEGDKLILTHRNIAYNLARAVSLKPILQEYLLKPDGLAEGRLGSMNLVNPNRGIIYSSSILGNNFPVASGIAMAEKVSGRPGVVFVFGGDGSIEEGSFYESLLLMKTLGLRIVIVIENNEWSLGTRVSERRCAIDLQKLVNSLGIPHFFLKGNHVREYAENLKNARERSVKENSPVCVEIEVRTLGDSRKPPTSEYPEGRHINYHAGPAPLIDIVKHSSGILREGESDPVFMLKEELGEEKFLELSRKIMEEVKTEIGL